MSTAWNNRFLFSHHYLEERCDDADDRTEAAHLVDALRGWTGSWDDRTLATLIRTQVGPTLVSLGFTYGDPAADEDPHRLRLYASYRKEQQVGICYVAHREDGEADLDSTIKGRHYAAEIIHALQEEGLSWGLLTDGKHWRLYHADELAPYETYLEIDLAQVLQGHGRGEDAAFLFHTLFHKAAFARAEDGTCALDDHLTASQRAASRIEKHLSGCIEEVLRDLCQGFVERDNKATYTSAERDEVFRNATVLLYRMLFMLYAEARELLPRDEPAYTPVSLDALVEQAVDYVRGSGLPDPDGTELWQALSNLSSWISSGNDERQIPAYNGDLFDDSDKRYIHDQTITDKYLAPALVSLGSLEDEAIETGARRIDYRDLSVRHLGSIYEGLLEYKLFIARERRVRRSDGKGGYTFPKLSETRLKKGEEENVIEVGDVYFANSAGERKAMGAYYTPEYIVDYIVKQTVLRGLQERRAALEAQLPGWIADVEAAPPGDRARLQAVVDQKLVDFVEQEVLTFRVCDPAMGSGHFLVNTVHAMTNFIVETLNLTPWENPKIDCDPVLWRRRVAKRCLYGVDLNELAVELAKLSLWLTTVAKGKPLSFLDHHLRHGNSLIGARFEDLIEVLSPKTNQDQASENGQLSMFDAYPAFRVPLMEALDLMRDISARLADAAEDVESQAADYAQLRQELKPYRDLADLLTARHFGVDVDEAQLRAIAHRLLGGDGKVSRKNRALLDRAHKVAEKQAFFHWELEFPGVFIDPRQVMPKEDQGFDALVANPPYGADLTSQQKEAISAWRKHSRSNDTVELFMERAQGLVGKGHKVGILVPKSVAFYSKWSGIRGHILSNHTVLSVLDVGLAFKGVTYEQVTIIFRKSFPQVNYTQIGIASPLRHPLWTKEIKCLGECRQELMQREEVIFFRPVEGITEKIIDKIESRSIRLGEIADDIFRGIYIPSAQRHKLPLGDIPFITRNAHVGRYCFHEIHYVQLSKEKWRKQAHEVMVPRIFLKALRGNRLTAAYDPGKILTTVELVNITLRDSAKYDPLMLVAVINSPVPSFYIQRMLFSNTTETARILDAPYSSAIRIPNVNFDSSITKCGNQSESLQKILHEPYQLAQIQAITDRVNRSFDELSSVAVHALLAHLADQMFRMHRHRQDLEKRTNVFRYVNTGQPVVSLDQAFILDKRVVYRKMDLESVHHDIDGLRLTPNADGTWTLELQAKFRDPEQGWQEWIKEEDGYSIKRRWVPAYRLKMSEEKARFYRYALPRLQDFDNARSFPGGYTRSTLKKLHLTQVPMMPDVDLSELARLDRELTETKRKIQLTDDLIDQIVYKLYGLTQEEIAIVEGRA